MTYREILAGLIVLLYLSDCLRLLEPGEVALATWGGNDWRVRFGSGRWQLSGKDVLLANPFAPPHILFIIRWRASAAAPQGPGAESFEQVRAAARALGTPGWLCWVNLVLAILLLPMLLLLQAGPLPIIACAATMYMNIAATGLMIYWRRSQLGIPAAVIAKACVEALLCPPYGANLARKMALALPTRQLSLAQAGAQLLDQRHREQAWEECRTRLAELMGEFDAGTAEYGQLRDEAITWTRQR